MAEAMASADVAAVLLRLADADERSLINLVKEIAPVVQRRDAALILAGRDDIVARSGADGAHLGNVEALRDAVSRLKPKSIAGVGGLHTRHDAMAAAEAGADYVMFGEPDAAGRRPSFDAIIDRVEWWAEVFEIPCVAYAARTRRNSTACRGRRRFRRHRRGRVRRSARGQGGAGRRGGAAREGRRCAMTDRGRLRMAFIAGALMLAVPGYAQAPEPAAPPLTPAAPAPASPRRRRPTRCRRPRPAGRPPLPGRPGNPGRAAGR